MASIINKYGVVIFSIIGALVIVGAAWGTKGTEDNDTWLYVFTIWMILFSAFEAHASVKIHKTSKIVLAALTGAFVIIVWAWWANGAEHAWIFLTSAAAMIVVFFAIASQKK